MTAYGQKSSSARTHTRADTRPLVEPKKPSGSALRLQAPNPHTLVPWSYSGCRREAKYDSKSWFQCFGVQLLEKKTKKDFENRIVKKKSNIRSETALHHHAAGVCPALDTDILLFIRDVYMRGTPYTNKAAQHHDFRRDSNTSPWEEDGYFGQIIKSFAYVRIFLYVFLRADHYIFIQ